MREGNLLLPMENLFNFLKFSFFGFNNKFMSIIESRIEFSAKLNFDEEIKYKWIVLNEFVNTYIPFHKDFKKREHLNILFLDLINSYRGHRHLRGLPTRGQRTWSNASIAFTSNNVLRLFKLKFFKKKYGNISPNVLNSAFLLETTNHTWKLQWHEEWLRAKYKRISKNKLDLTFLRIDIQSFSRFNPNLKESKKQKYSPIGFDWGFTKFILKNKKRRKDR